MKIIAISVGKPQEVPWEGEMVLTSIFKTPVEGKVRVTRLNIEGDEQSDLEVHGGDEKAVYAYPTEHYAWWREQLPGTGLPWGAFGENLSVEGLLEDQAWLGDRLRAGTAEFMITEPRMPCYKLALKFKRADIVKRFMRSGRTGYYLSVVKEGVIAAGDEVEVIPGARRLTIAAVVANKARKSLGF